ncbi:hypothetical protein F1559_004506 [Cyanidiococcus yangmingshanensis]|uniref:Uncharacterized protein n=1 Tax=Cyanidiococcus yangmingshanensis TaxID=2690220 RepID=A0A7J7IS13_9RHOD|nr:hypothetical protein F1559_004506 [Cyanidiococcus yangmingshanensis]
MSISIGERCFGPARFRKFVDEHGTHGNSPLPKNRNGFPRRIRKRSRTSDEIHREVHGRERRIITSRMFGTSSWSGIAQVLREFADHLNFNVVAVAGNDRVAVLRFVLLERLLCALVNTG